MMGLEYAILHAAARGYLYHFIPERIGQTFREREVDYVFCGIGVEKRLTYNIKYINRKLVLLLKMLKATAGRCLKSLALVRA